MPSIAEVKQIHVNRILDLSGDIEKIQNEILTKQGNVHHKDSVDLCLLDVELSALKKQLKDKTEECSQLSKIFESNGQKTLPTSTTKIMNIVRTIGAILKKNPKTLSHSLYAIIENTLTFDHETLYFWHFINESVTLAIGDKIVYRYRSANLDSLARAYLSRWDHVNTKNMDWLMSFFADSEIEHDKITKLFEEILKFNNITPGRDVIGTPHIRIRGDNEELKRVFAKIRKLNISVDLYYVFGKPNKTRLEIHRKKFGRPVDLNTY